MASFLFLLVALNVGFLIGAWWGSGWRRRERSKLQAELGRLRRVMEDPPNSGVIPLFDSIELVHTEIYEEFEGRGLGSQLISFALQDARERGLAVLPFCPFVNDYVQRHRQYVDLVPEGRRAEFEL